MIRPVVHLALHVLVPLGVARAARGARWLGPFVAMMATMAVDLDHLAADPVYDPNRCGIGFHPLHEPALFPVWILLASFVRTRWVGVGLLIHMTLDGLDCALL